MEIHAVPAFRDNYIWVIAEGNRTTARLLAEAGCEVHTYAAQEIGINGSGGPTCLTRPILRG